MISQKNPCTDIKLSAYFLAPHTQEKGNMEDQRLNSEFREILNSQIQIFSSFC